MPESFGGIPLHPLIVHAVVVLVPLAALAVALSAVLPRFRSWSGLMTPLLATLAMVMVPLATGSGEALEEKVQETALVEKHTEMGEQLTPWVIGLAVLAWALWWLGRRAARAGDRSSFGGPVVMVAAALALVAVAGSGVQVFRIGHSGAESVWSDTGSGTSGESGDG